MITGSYAFLTSTTETLENVVVLGDINIKLTEPKWTELPDSDSDKIPDIAEAVYPNQTITKDPTIVNDGTNSAYVFLKVEVPKSTVKYVTESQTINEPTDPVDLFSYKTNDGWIKFLEETDADDKNVYYYYYQNPLTSNESTLPLFDEITYLDVIEGQIEGEKQIIGVTAYGAQVSEYEAENKNIAAWNELAIQEGLPLCN